MHWCTKRKHHQLWGHCQQLRCTTWRFWIKSGSKSALWFSSGAAFGTPGKTVLAIMKSLGQWWSLSFNHLGQLRNSYAIGALPQLMWASQISYAINIPQPMFLDTGPAIPTEELTPGALFVYTVLLVESFYSFIGPNWASEAGLLRRSPNFNQRFLFHLPRQWCVGCWCFQSLWCHLVKPAGTGFKLFCPTNAYWGWPQLAASYWMYI